MKTTLGSASKPANRGYPGARSHRDKPGGVWDSCAEFLGRSLTDALFAAVDQQVRERPKGFFGMQQMLLIAANHSRQVDSIRGRIPTSLGGHSQGQQAMHLLDEPASRGRTQAGPLSHISALL